MKLVKYTYKLAQIPTLKKKKKVLELLSLVPRPISNKKVRKQDLTCSQP
jgi:hypothetical protein